MDDREEDDGPDRDEAPKAPPSEPPAGEAPIDATPKTVMMMGARGVKLESLNEALRFAKAFVGAGLAADGETAHGVLMKMQMGAELGFPPMQALQQVVNVYGRLGLQGAGMLALIRSKRKLVALFKPGFVGERVDGEWPDDAFGFVDVERDGVKDRIVFTVADAKAAGLWNRKSRAGKAGPWTYYQKDMLIWKAVARASKLYCSDLTNGLDVAETMVEEAYVTEAMTVARQQPATVSPVAMSAAAIRGAAKVVEVVENAPAGPSVAPNPAPAPAAAPQEAPPAAAAPAPAPQQPEVAPEPAPAAPPPPAPVDDRTDEERKLDDLFG